MGKSERMIQNDIAISVKDVRKSFKLFYDRGYSLKEVLLFRKRRRYETHQVLRGISFDVKKGEAIGLIGHNGCGKSTMLKLLTRIMYPDSGTVELNGRVSSLIELGAGFHPDMSGRENIYTNAAIFGLSRKEIDSRIQRIIDFSEIEEFIDNPVRTYSSGMYMRLAFSVAINVDADILLIDEILAVGDVTFQNKCFNRLKEIKSKGTTIVIVSHSLAQIEQICDRSIWIHDGLIKEEGSPKKVHMDYFDFMIQKQLERDRENVAKQSAEQGSRKSSEVALYAEISETASRSEPSEQSSDTLLETAEKKRWGNRNAEITFLKITDINNEKRSVFKTGADIIISFDYCVFQQVSNAVFGIGLFNSDGVQCYGTNTRIDGIPRFSLSKNSMAKILLKNVSLLPGKYLVDIAIESENGIPVDYYREACSFEMVSPVSDVGICRVEHQWDL